jgi:hypothetical protein
LDGRAQCAAVGEAVRVNSVVVEQTENSVAIELVAIHTDYYYMHPAQVVGEHKQALPLAPDPPEGGGELEP